MESLRNQVYRLLRKSEQFFKTDMVYLFKGGFWLVLKQGSSALISFLLAIAFANYVLKENYGIYKYIVSVASIIGGFSLAGFKTSIIQSVAKGKEGSLKYAFHENLRWGVIVFLISIGVSLYYFLNENYMLSAAFVIVGIFTPIANSASLYDSFLMGKKDFKASYQVYITRNLLASLAMLIAIIVSGNPLILSIANFVIPALFAYSAYRVVLGKYKPNEEIDEKSMSYGRHLSLMSLATNFANRFDGLLIFHYLGATPLAVYSFAGAIPDQVISLLKQGHFLALPKLSQSDKAETKRTLLRKSFIIFLAMLGVFLVYLAAAPLIFKIFFPRYLEAVPYSQLFALNFVVAGFTLLAGTFLDSQVETKYKYRFTWYSTVLRSVLMFVLIFPLGVYGVILGEILSRILSGILIFYFVKKV